MKKVSRIHKGKSGHRRHFLKEWLDARDMSPMDLLDALNDPERASDLPEIDKSQVYRWLKGQLPHPPTQERIAAALDLTDPETGEPDPSALIRHPDNDWFSRQIAGREEDEVARMKQAIELIFQRRTGTED